MGFDVIFNYGCGCCAYAHNICRSLTEVPYGISDTSKSLSLEFFINPRCPLGAVPAETISIDVRPGKVTNAPEREDPTAVLKTDDSKAGEHLSTTEVEPGKEPAYSA